MRKESDTKRQLTIIPFEVLTGASSARPTQSSREKSRSKKNPVLPIPANLLESLACSLTAGDYECMVCYSEVKPANATWSCEVCYAVFHLKCIEVWGRKSLVAEVTPRTAGAPSSRGWRCPGCQNIKSSIPTEYKCFCSKETRPSANRYITPHTCGNVCGRKKEAPCTHGCVLPCHPGPCPPCSLMAPPKICFCGRNVSLLRCIENDGSAHHSCGIKCGELLGCGLHTCSAPCHENICPPCTESERQRCYCGLNERMATCGSGFPLPIAYEKSIDSNKRVNVSKFHDSQDQSSIGNFECDAKCDRLLSCGIHKCQKSCHLQYADPELCPLDPSRVKFCHCGKMSVEKALGRPRKSCEEAVPSCGKICGQKHFSCDHECPSTCHTGPCPPCIETVTRPCRCGATEVKGQCYKWEAGASTQPLCQRICRSLRNCRRHQCGVRCCPSSAHRSRDVKSSDTATMLENDPDICTLICGKTLRCGIHACANLCHKGTCPPCLEASFEEMICHCGRTSLNVFPIPCGASMPRCPYPCKRGPPACGHPLTPHNCHGDDEPCPPCVHLTRKICQCGKVRVNNVPCHRQAVSCGVVCRKKLSCGGHFCQRVCHSGDCLVSADGNQAVCSQVCGKARPDCGHSCLEKCHTPSSCPEDVPCPERVAITCSCGHLSQQVKCGIAAKTLSCNDQCLVAERNKRVAEALGIDKANEDSPLSPSTPEYTGSLLRHGSAHTVLAKSVESQLAAFVNELYSDLPTNTNPAAKRTRISFPPMKAPHRAFIHELCAYYNLTSESVDAEPYRSVVVTKARLTIPQIPKIGIIEAIANRKSGKPSGLTQASSLPPTSLVGVDSSVSMAQHLQDTSKSLSADAGMTTSTTTAPLKPARATVNALRLIGLRFGATAELLHPYLSAVFGRLRYTLQWSVSPPETTHELSDGVDAVLVIPDESSLPRDETEFALYGAQRAIRPPLMADGIVKGVDCVWVTSTGKIEPVTTSSGKTATTSLNARTSHRLPRKVTTANAFAELSLSSDESDDSKSTPSSAMKEDINDVVPEDWEEVAD